MGSVLSEFAKRVAGRWFELLVVPGALYLVALAVAHTWGWSHPFGFDRLDGRLTAWSESRRLRSTGGLVVLLAAATAAAAVIGMAVGAIAALVESFWFADGRRTRLGPLRRLVRGRVGHRRRTWEERRRDFQRAHDREVDAVRYGRPRDPDGLDAAHRKLLRVAPEHPATPTWIGDRVNAVAVRARREHGLDLDLAWPYLWVVLPETARTEIVSVRSELSGAARLAGWSVLYALAGILSWPAFLLAACLAAAARHRGRTTAATYARLLDATVRLHGTDLADSLGIPHHGTLDASTGYAVTSALTPSTPPAGS